MPKMYSADRKLSAQLVYNHVQSIRKTADILCVSKSSVQRWVVSLISKILASPIKKFQTTKLTLILETVELCLKSDPFLTCKKLKALIKENLGLEVSKELVRLSIVKLSYTRKKARFYGLAKNALKLNRAFLKLRNLFYQARSWHFLYRRDLVWSLLIRSGIRICNARKAIVC